MKTKLHHDDLTYGVLLAALAAFAFATVLDSMHVEQGFGPQAGASTQVATALSAAAVASATQATLTAR